MGKIFISYARSDDEPFVKQLYEDLTKRGIDVWWDREKMESRGRTFLQEIRDAIAESERVLLVIGPNAIKSRYVRDEWEHALLFSRAVVPVLRQGETEDTPPEIPKVHRIDFRVERPYELALNELLRILVEPVPPLSPINATPQLPPHFVIRKKAIADITEMILADLKTPTAITHEKQVTAIIEMGGSGKSVIAAAFARSREARMGFSDGIVWLSIGQKVDESGLVKNMKILADALGDKDIGNYFDLVIAKTHLSRILENKNCLFVLDDVWDIRVAEFFRDIIGPRSRILLTTRDKSIASSIGAQEYLLGLLEESQAETLFADWVGINIEALGSQGKQLIAECGKLPFALALCGAMARDGTHWRHILDALKDADLTFIEKEFPNYPYKNMLKCLKVSLDALEAEDPNAFKCYLELAVFPREAIPKTSVVTLWLHNSDLKERDAEKLLTKMANKALLKLEDQEDARRFVLLHDLQNDYLRSVTTDFRGLHNQLLEAYWKESNGSWQGGPNDGYYFEHLIHHLIEAGRKSDVQTLLQSLSWIQVKLEATNAIALISDFNLYLEEGVCKDKVEAFKHFVKNQAYILEQNPELVFQQAINQPDGSSVFLEAKSLLKSGKITYPWFQWINKPQKRDPCILTLKNYTDLSPVDERNAYTAWMDFCVWSPDSKRILSTSGDYNTLMVWDNTLKVWDAETGQELQTLKGHTEHINSFCWSPDGKRILSASNDHTLKVWDAETGQELQTLKGHEHVVRSCAWSPDGKRILSASNDHTLKVWDGETGQELQTLKGHTDDISLCCWSPDGQRILSASEDSMFKESRLKVWDGETGQELQTLKGHIDWCRSCAFSPDGERILSATYGGTLRVWDAETGQELVTLKGHAKGVVSGSWSPDGQRILSASEDKTLIVWNSQSGQSLETLRGHTGFVTSCGWSPDGQRILSASDDGTLKVWDAKTGRELQTLKGHADSISVCAWSPDGQRILAASRNTLKVWDASNSQELQSQIVQTDFGNLCGWSPDGQRILTASNDGTLKVLDTETGLELQTLTGHTGKVGLCAWSRDGKRILLVSDDSTFRIWDAETGKALTTLKGYAEGATSFKWSPDDQRVVSDSWNSTFRVWDTNTGQLLQSLKCPDTLSYRESAWSPDGRLVLSTSNNTLKVWDPETGRELQTLKGHADNVCSCAWSPDGQRILSASFDTLKVWDAETGLELQTLKGHKHLVTSCGWSPDGQHIISTSWDGTLRVWNAQTGKEMQTLRGHTEGVLSYAWSLDGRYILSSSRDRMLKVWNTKTGCALATFAHPTIGYSITIGFIENGECKVIACENLGRLILLRLLGV